MSDSLWPHGLQHTRLTCPSPTPRIYSNSCPLSQRCRPTTSSSVALFSFFFQSFAASRCFPMSWLFVSGGQNIRASASASVLPVNIQGWFPLGLTGLILQSKKTLKSPSAPQFESISFLALSLLYDPALTWLLTLFILILNVIYWLPAFRDEDVAQLHPHWHFSSLNSLNIVCNILLTFYIVTT